MSENNAKPAAPRSKGKSKTGGGSAKARRKAARLAAVQALYQVELSGNSLESVVREFIEHYIGHEIDGVSYVAAEPQLFADIVRGAWLRKPEVDGLLGAALDVRYPVERLEALLRAVLRAGVYELFAHVDTPARILISEYVDVAKAFFGGREPGMTNAVLDNVARTLRPEDMDGTGEGATADE